MATSSALRNLAAGFGQLSDPTRLGILKMLSAGPKSVTALCGGLGIKQPMASHHLGLLRLGRMIVGTRKGKSVVYAADAESLKELASAIAKLTPRK